MSFSPFPSQILGLGDVAVLTGFVAAAKQNYEKRTTLLEVNSVTWSVVNSQLANALTNGLGVTSESFC
jgi:hypothetical protein